MTHGATEPGRGATNTLRLESSDLALMIDDCLLVHATFPSSPPSWLGQLRCCLSVTGARVIDPSQ